jgi:hypothetical protein
MANTDAPLKRWEPSEEVLDALADQFDEELRFWFETQDPLACLEFLDIAEDGHLVMRVEPHIEGMEPPVVRRIDLTKLLQEEAEMWAEEQQLEPESDPEIQEWRERDRRRLEGAAANLEAAALFIRSLLAGLPPRSAIGEKEGDDAR